MSEELPNPSNTTPGESSQASRPTDAAEAGYTADHLEHASQLYRDIIGNQPPAPLSGETPAVVPTGESPQVTADKLVGNVDSTFSDKEAITGEAAAPIADGASELQGAPHAKDIPYRAEMPHEDRIPELYQKNNEGRFVFDRDAWNQAFEGRIAEIEEEIAGRNQELAKVKEAQADMDDPKFQNFFDMLSKVLDTGGNRKDDTAAKSADIVDMSTSVTESAGTSPEATDTASNHSDHATLS